MPTRTGIWQNRYQGEKKKRKVNKYAEFGLWAGLTAAAWMLKQAYDNPTFEKVFSTFFSLTMLYIVFKILIDGKVLKRIPDAKTKYSFSRITSTLYIGLFVAVLIGVWVENPDALLVAYGLVAAGVAISLQDLFKNLAGGIILFTTKTYAIGDRIEINSKVGDVIDIGIMYTTVLELREWVDGDQTTGRLSSIPNGAVLSSAVTNYTKDHEFVWDEITIPITYDSDWKSACESIGKIVKTKTQEVITQAEKEMAHLEQKYYMTKRDAEPSVFITLTDNWIKLTVRYVTSARSRRTLHNMLSQAILDHIEKSKHIKIASTTLALVKPEKKKSTR